MKRAAILTLAAVLVTGGVWLAWPDDVALAGASRQAAAPASLHGTAEDGAVRSQGGTLVVDRELRRLFDYHLSALGERDLQATRQAVARSLQHLPATAHAEAMRLFERYLAYKKALQALDGQNRGNDIASISARLYSMRELRNGYFSPSELQAFFGDEDRYDDAALAVAEIRSRPGLSAEDKARRIQKLEASLPKPLREARQAPVLHAALRDAEAQLRQQGGGDAELYQLRSQMVGQAAADRLSELDREQATWQQRITGYLAERQRILDDTALDAPARQAALQTLAASRFTPQEQQRLAAYEKR